MQSPLSPSETRALLEQLGHRPIKKLGQNFLIDGNVVRKSIEFANIQKGDRVIEIGPGLGTLTRALLNRGAIVYSIEKDRRLAAHLKILENEFQKQFHLIEGDAMDHPLAGFNDANEPFKIVANLPYAISTPWMESILKGLTPQSMTLMLQREAAQRFTARPGTKQFGSISIFLQSAFNATKSHNVAAHCFYPRPEVDSQLLHLEVKADPYFFSAQSRQLIRELFRQRRKQIGSLLRKQSHQKAKIWLDRLRSQGIPINSRPEQIDLNNWIHIDQD